MAKRTQPRTTLASRVKPDPRMDKAYCWRTGLVDFGKVVPNGAILLMPVPDKKTRDKIEVLCRPSKDGKEFYIPGIPETDDDLMALKEMQHFRKMVEWALEPKKTRSPNWPKRDFDNPERIG